MINSESAGYSNIPTFIRTILDFKIFNLNLTESKIHWNVQDGIIIGKRVGITINIPRFKRRFAIYTDKVDLKLVIKTNYTLAG